MGIPITKAPPHLVVTDDGRRPWHDKFAVRQLDDGRLIAFWLGSWNWGERQHHRYRDASERALRLGKFELGYTLHRIGASLFGGDFPLFVSGSYPHPDFCGGDYYVGIAFLPKPPSCWLATAIWPGWKHLVHGKERCEEMLKRLERMTPKELLAILEAET